MNTAQRQRVDRAIALGVDFLRRSQLAHGELRCWVSTDPTFRTSCQFDSSVFAAAQVGHSLRWVPAQGAQEVVRGVERFLFSQMGAGGLWRFWSRGHAGHLNIPPDVDDTACISEVLRAGGIAFPDNVPAILGNRDSEGRFYTWIVPRSRHLRWPRAWPALARVVRHRGRVKEFFRSGHARVPDVDGVVNANVLLYLGEGPATRGAVDYLKTILRRREEASCDRWYRSRFAVYYAVARCVAAGVRGLAGESVELVDRLRGAESPEGRFGEGVCDNALAVASLQMLGASSPEVGRGVQYLLEQQATNGSWPAERVYHDGGPNEEFGWGSEEITTGYCLEALSRTSR